MSIGTFLITSAKAACTGHSQRQKPAENRLICSQIMTLHWCASCAVGPQLLSGASHGNFTSGCSLAAGAEAGLGPALLWVMRSPNGCRCAGCPVLRVKAGEHQLLGQPPAGPPRWALTITPTLSGCLLPAGPVRPARRQIVLRVNFPFKMQTRFDRVN